ncbi:MAG: TetR/AcrR family transcriptional regulator [bacterium]|nr:TetR/AcrR family transcriptional regulator [bacterium]
MASENINEVKTTQQRILSSAIREFAEFGKAGARVDRIAETAGVNKAMIYYHFNSKENLYYEAIAEHISQVTANLQRRVSSSNTLEEIISSVVDEYILIFGSDPCFKQILLRELAEEGSPIIAKIAETISRSGVPNILYNKLLSEMEKGRIKQLDIRQAIASLISMNIGFFIVSPIVVKVLNISDIDSFLSARRKAVVDLFLSGVLIK